MLMRPKPKALDLFCCAGGAGMGLHQAGFEVVGVDIEAQPRYPFAFVQADALTYPLEGFDFIWASPPCQGYSHLTPKDAKGGWARLIPAVRARLIGAGVPYCIENVVGARKELIDPILLCGSMFGLRTQRHRLFETSFGVVPPKQCNHSEIPLLVTTASKASRERRFKLGMVPKTVKNAPLAYGIDWMDFSGLKEAIPPVYAKFIGHVALEHIRQTQDVELCVQTG
jgi:DNA (cytosine-5)-methyltransferase 1